MIELDLYGLVPFSVSVGLGTKAIVRNTDSIVGSGETAWAEIPKRSIASAVVLPITACRVNTLTNSIRIKVPRCHIKALAADGLAEITQSTGWVSLDSGVRTGTVS